MDRHALLQFFEPVNHHLDLLLRLRGCLGLSGNE
jgi:hypothetical protein